MSPKVFNLALTLLLIPFLGIANRVVINGTVKFPNGEVAVNFPVKIQTEATSTTTNCNVGKTVLTNANGVYEGVLECTNQIGKVSITYKNCDGQNVTIFKEVPSSAVITADILLCKPTNCAADYSWFMSSNASLKIQFNSSNSTASGPLPDEITERTWSWGDGSPLTQGNIVNPEHIFTNAGTFDVCLRIITRNGCLSYSCQKVVVKATAECVANFTWEKYSQPLVFKFFDTSKAMVGDEIISRQWSWGDGSGLLDGNQKYPVHQFAAAGSYEICLAIKTKNGCEKRVCKKFVIEATGCKAVFRWENYPGTNVNPPGVYTKFFSGQSHSSNPGSSVIGRYWVFGDGSTLSTNDSNVVHIYKNPGTYTACLYIKTTDGCYDSTCSVIKVPEPPALHCEAAFRFERIDLNSTNYSTTYKFFSGNSVPAGTNDKITTRYWKFGDGTSLTTNDSNVVHTYQKPGQYTVCLWIKTDRGCYDSVCREIVVPNPPALHCEAAFKFERTITNDAYTVFKFFSGYSIAAGPNDKIIGRYWTFGDGKTLSGNDSNVTHTYIKPGQYTVCLWIKTDRGCYDSVCREIVVPNPPVLHCEAAFKFERINLSTTNYSTTYKFFSGNSVPAGTNDKIITRYWKFGDGSSLTTNDSNVVHTYQKPGQYTVCLWIKTDRGCYDSVCREIVVPNPPVLYCEAAFRFERMDLNSTNYSTTFKFFSGNSVPAGTNDKIITRYWKFGDGSSLTTNDSNVVHTYQKPGQYTVCLWIKTDRGCYDSVCREIVVPNPPALHCEAAFKFERIDLNSTNYSTTFKFFSGNSVPAGTNDKIITRYWKFGDGSSLTTNDSNVVHTFQKPGQYTVCLWIKTDRGCYDSVCREIVVPNPPALHCEANFSFLKDGMQFHFIGYQNGIIPGDSIVKRTWRFGDNTIVDGNVKDPVHTYEREGQYEVCLFIVTKKGCESKICKLVVVEKINHECHAIFRYENTASRQVRFNSSASYADNAGDSIVKRTWYFGDGLSSNANQVAPLHEYKMAGTYNACLVIVTKSGCENLYCHEVKVTGEMRPDSADIRLVSIYPNPARDHLFSMIWSKQEEVKAELAIYDVYGFKKWSKQIILPAGYSTWQVPTGFLPGGPYILKLTTSKGIQYRTFLKLN